MRPWKVDVPVRVNIWIRPECQRKQFEVLRQACPSIMFVQSDGGRNEAEWEAIRQNRKIFDEEIDWDCQVYRLYEDHNLGLYAMENKVMQFAWERVDRCIILEDDQIPAVSFFQYCAELLEKYKDDKRVIQICGNNVFGTYPDAEPYDYFFTQNGWSVWGTATWRDRMLCDGLPLAYADDEYIKKCLKRNLTKFWYKKVEGYCRGELYDNHVPGTEYFTAANSALYHGMSIVPTKNMISNIGYVGAHAHHGKGYIPEYFCLPTYELEFPIKHPLYVIDDVDFGERYEKYIGNCADISAVIVRRAKQCLRLILAGEFISALKRKIKQRHQIET